MSSIEIDPFHATASILRNFPDGSAFQALIEENLNLPVSRSDFINVMIAQSQINVMVAGALVHLRRSDFEALSTSLQEILDRIQQNTQFVAEIMKQMVMDEHVRRAVDAEGQIDE